MYSASPNIVSRGFLTIFPQRPSISERSFTHLIYVRMYAILQNFIQSSLTLTKLCPIKRNHPVNAYISLPASECDTSLSATEACRKQRDIRDKRYFTHC